jgi:predicted enzyme related to lactoylglutathione lyase
MTDTTRYTFTKLVVADLDASARYYRDVFGLHDLHRVQASIGGAPIDEIILGKDGGFDGGLILLAFPGSPAPEPGAVILGFTTNDLPALVARAVAAGGTVLEDVHVSTEGGGRRIAFVRDPEGNLAELVESV